MQPTVTVTDCVPVIAGFWFEVAVTLADPTETDVTNPVELMVAIVVGVMLQLTEGLLLVLPSLFVPNTVICTVLSVAPVSIVGDDGPTARDEIVGLTKNPVQPTAMAVVRSAAKAPNKRSLFFAGAIEIQTPQWARCRFRPDYETLYLTIFA